MEGSEHQPHDAAKRRAAMHLEQRWHEGIVCPFCGSEDWRVGEPVRLLTTADVLVRMHPVGCGDCGVTVFLRHDKVEADAG